MRRPPAHFNRAGWLVAAAIWALNIAIMYHAFGGI